MDYRFLQSLDSNSESGCIVIPFRPDKMKSDHQEKQAIIVVMRDQIRDLTIENADLHKKVSQLTACQQQISDQGQRISELEQLVQQKNQLIASSDRDKLDQEAAIRRLQEDVRRATESLTQSQAAVSHLSRESDQKDDQIRRLMDERRIRDHSLAEAREKLSDCEQQVDHLRSELAQVKEATTADRQSLDHLLNETRDKLSSAEDQVVTLTADLSKANEIIRKLQAEIAKAKDKVNILNDISHRQEDVVSDKDKAVRQLESDLQICITRIQKKEKEQEQQIRELDKLRSKFRDSQEQISTNEQLITFLNQQIAELNGKITAAEVAAAAAANTGTNMAGIRKKTGITGHRPIVNRNIVTTSSTATTSNGVNNRIVNGKSASASSVAAAASGIGCGNGQALAEANNQIHRMSQQLVTLRQQAASSATTAAAGTAMRQKLASSFNGPPPIPLPLHAMMTSNAAAAGANAPNGTAHQTGAAATTSAKTSLLSNAGLYCPPEPMPMDEPLRLIMAGAGHQKKRFL